MLTLFVTYSAVFGRWLWIRLVIYARTLPSLTTKCVKQSILWKGCISRKSGNSWKVSLIKWWVGIYSKVGLSKVGCLHPLYQFLNMFFFPNHLSLPTFLLRMLLPCQTWYQLRDKLFQWSFWYVSPPAWWDDPELWLSWSHSPWIFNKVNYIVGLNPRNLPNMDTKTP